MYSFIELNVLKRVLVALEHVLIRFVVVLVEFVVVVSVGLGDSARILLTFTASYVVRSDLQLLLLLLLLLHCQRVRDSSVS